MTKIHPHKKIYIIHSYNDVDGAIAAAICQRHLTLKYIQLNKSSDKISIEFDIRPVPRPTHKTQIAFVPRTTNKTQSSSGYLRQHYKEFGISKKIIMSFDDFIDMAEILQSKSRTNLPLVFSAHGSTTESGQDFSSTATKLYFLFHTKHPLIDKEAIYKKLVYQIAKNPCIEDLFDSDILFSSIIEYEKTNIRTQLH